MTNTTHETVVKFYSLRLSERREIAEWLGVSWDLAEESDVDYSKRILLAARDSGKIHDLVDKIERYIARHAPKPSPDPEETYKPTGVALTPYEREILTILQEECAEVIVAASKILRFGKDDSHPDSTVTNSNSLSLEIGDVEAMIFRATEVGLVMRDVISLGMHRKNQRLKRYMQTKSPLET